ncbi:MAG: TlpA family protein disulfide reductase [Alphaproteobacteria bacterium]|nr:TlpA family protein disulfide reductase [Alphaproteobacteria bacterium]
MKLAVLFASLLLGLVPWADRDARASSAAASPAQAATPGTAASLGAFAVGELRNLTFSTERKPVAAAPFKDEQDRNIDLGAFRGKVVLVNLWATWCVPCRAEMPALDRLQQELGGADFEVVAVAQERAGPDKARAFLAEVGAGHLRLYIDQTMKSARAWGAVGLPTTFLLDRQGREIGRLVGAAEWDAPEALALIRALMAAE